MSENIQNTILFTQVVDLVHQSKLQVVRAINQTMVYTYYEIGRMIVEDEQKGESRAEYGKQILKGLSVLLTSKFGKGFSLRNLEQMRAFYYAYSISASVMRISESSITQSLPAFFKIPITQSLTAFSDDPIPQSVTRVFNLTWTHYNLLVRIDNVNERSFYEIEAVKNNWSVRELQRQYDTALYSRLISSRNKEEVLALSKVGWIIEKPSDIIKDPYILEFLELPELSSFSESELEEGIINKLEHFLMELGNGFTFVARQKRISFDDKHFRIDLVFYNRILKSFVLIDLKIGDLKHQDLGQMLMYVNYYDREMRLEDENKTIGIVLCQNKSELVVEYTLPENNNQIFASKYKTVLPSEEEFIRILENQLK